MGEDRGKNKQNSAGKRHLINHKAVASLIVAFALVLSLSAATGDIMVNGGFSITYHYQPPSIVVNQTNVTYKAATFVWNTTTVNNSTVGTLRVHVNFDSNNTSEFWNLLSLVYTGNGSANFTVLIVKEAKIGNYTLNSSYSSTIRVFINHNWQNSSDPGLELLNNTTSPSLPLYPSNEVSYYIGVIYTVPPDLPAWVNQNLNALGEYITFTFTFT